MCDLIADSATDLFAPIPHGEGQTVLREALSRGCTIVLSTHQLREALELATHVALLNRGALAYHGERTAEMLADPGWLYARYGESG